ncbi:MAG: hypothetical protein M5U34_01655 [Chloroflexi bacterium]|nr:hypothetical protein [Chloroflexota bacterium]
MNKLQISRRWLLIGLFLVLGIFTVTLAQPTLAQDRAANGVVTTGSLNVRSAPGVEFRLSPRPTRDMSWRC